MQSVGQSNCLFTHATSSVALVLINQVAGMGGTGIQYIGAIIRFIVLLQIFFVQNLNYTFSYVWTKFYHLKTFFFFKGQACHSKQGNNLFLF